MVYNQHFSSFVFPFSGDRWLGALTEWLPVVALFTPDSYAPAARRDQWQKIATYSASVWILIQERCPSFLDDLNQMHRLGARLCMSMSPTSKVVHHTACWADVHWDSYPTGMPVQHWKIERPSAATPTFLNLPLLLGGRETKRYDFHYFNGESPPALGLHWENQQDAIRHTWKGHIAGTDGGVQWKEQRMTAGYVLGSDRTPETVLAVRVGGPLSSLRAKAVALYQLLMTLLSSRLAMMAPLLVFVDNLILLHILDHCGRLNYHPGPTVVIHFDVIMQLLGVLRQRQLPIRLVKVKSHSGCLLNDRSDEQADRGYTVETPEAFPATPKFTSLTLRVHNPVRELNSECKTLIPLDNAPNCKILRGVISTNL